MLEERLMAQARGEAQVGNTKAVVTRDVGQSEADVLRDKLFAEAKGLTEKFTALASLSDQARSHEEFRMQLEKNFEQRWLRSRRTRPWRRSRPRCCRPRCPRPISTSSAAVATSSTTLPRRCRWARRSRVSRPRAPSCRSCCKSSSAARACPRMH
ncbi:hypothetical protein [Comamonas sp. JC664]|uniref:hypothetical protein n=1 Tax=Comamonas sp. JC664 TaxID=2801917 RepID=UPI00361FE055